MACDSEVRFACEVACVGLANSCQLAVIMLHGFPLPIRFLGVWLSYLRVIHVGAH